MLPNTERADLQLLLTVISVHNVKIDYDAVTTALGFGCTTRAVQERMKKITKIVNSASGNINTDSNEAPGMASTTTMTKYPTLKKRKAPVSTLASQKKAKKDKEANEVVEEDDIDDDEEEGGVKLDQGTETNSKQSHVGAQGCGLLLEDGLEHNEQMFELLPYEEDVVEPHTL